MGRYSTAILISIILFLSGCASPPIVTVRATTADIINQSAASEAVRIFGNTFISRKGDAYFAVLIYPTRDGAVILSENLLFTRARGRSFVNEQAHRSIIEHQLPEFKFVHLLNESETETIYIVLDTHYCVWSVHITNNRIHTNLLMAE